ncbi:hypothetical protein GH714_024981 [Hevea brasiliensis]|uniref:Uncharacterized protein n=1 Tax=Hevea brasiliensis TaxID=3981 RepID=A0A6A6N5N8_HEVBR|nr:hypothetical protein GH714_024981 [Hevea brasiliensis]
MEYCFHRSSGSSPVFNMWTPSVIKLMFDQGVASAVVVEAYKDARNAADSIDEMRYYEKSLDKNYEKLQDAIKKVYARKGDLLVKINRDRTKQATEECNVWMGSVKKLEKEVLALKAEYEEEKSHKFKSVRLCPRSNLSKRMVEKL